VINNPGMKIGPVITKLRSERGLSLEDLADKCGITKSNLSRIETKDQWPRPELLDAIADVLGVKVYQLFAMAEAIQLPVDPLQLNREENQVLQAFQAMEPDARAAYLEMAKVLTKKPLKRRGPSL
jgi:transcriptional regulator with XRE-family HTH domain